MMPGTPRHVLIPTTGRELVRRELLEGFHEAGLRAYAVPPDVLSDPQSLAKAADALNGEPALFFSVNFQGLPSLRDNLETLARINCRPAVWFVDNPWNILAGVRDPRWKQIPLFVTDASFIEPLKEHGAEQVFHLPLATQASIFSSRAEKNETTPDQKATERFLFVGRSAFPGKEQFFAKQEIPEALFEDAKRLIRQGDRPDFLWWVKKLDCTPASFWPGKKARKPALGAEESNLYWRGLCLHEAAKAGAQGQAAGIAIIGDSGWRELLPENARLSPPVDYYSAALANLYRKHPYSLALTSLQLPQGLNQRHFDVWAAGGVCLSDATPGLQIFPEDLTRPITFSQAQGMEKTVEAVENYGRARLSGEWKELILEQHQYKHRARAVLEALG